MRKLALLFTLTVALAIAAIACDRGGETTTPIAGSTNALVGDETEADTAAADTALEPVADTAGETEDVEPDEVPPLAVSWTDAAETSESSSLSFDVTNTTSETLSFTVALFASSLVGSAEKAVGEGALGPGEVAAYTVAADELPLRSSAVVSVLAVRIRREVSMPGGWREVASDLAERYYLHAEGYGSVRAFTEAQIRDERGGVLLSIPLPPAATAESTVTDVVGDAWDGVAYAEKAKGDTGLFLRDGDGNVYGVVTEARLGSGPVPDAADTSPDEGDTGETEVAHE